MTTKEDSTTRKKIEAEAKQAAEREHAEELIKAEIERLRKEKEDAYESNTDLKVEQCLQSFYHHRNSRLDRSKAVKDAAQLLARARVEDWPKSRLYEELMVDTNSFAFISDADIVNRGVDLVEAGMDEVSAREFVASYARCVRASLYYPPAEGALRKAAEDKLERLQKEARKTIRADRLAREVVEKLENAGFLNKLLGITIAEVTTGVSKVIQSHGGLQWK